MFSRTAQTSLSSTLLLLLFVFSGIEKATASDAPFSPLNLFLSLEPVPLEEEFHVEDLNEPFSRDSEPLSFVSYRGSDIRPKMEEVKKRVWYQIYGNFSRESSEENDRGFSTDAYGVFAGYDKRVGRFASIGFGLGGDWVSVDKKGESYRNKISSVKGILNAQLHGNRWYWDLEASLGGGKYKENHVISGQSVRNSHWNNQWKIATELGFHWERGLTQTEPFFILQRSSIDDGGEGKNLTLAAIGCRYNWRFAGPLAIVKPEIFGGFMHQFDSDLYSSGTWIPGATLYRIPDAEVEENRFFLGTSLYLSMRKTMDVYAKYGTEISGNYNSHTILAGMHWNF